jgi:hypothetical protein
VNLLPALEKMFHRSVQPQSVVTLTGGASPRRYHRAILPKGCEPGSLIAMELPKGGELCSGQEPTELPFVNVGRHLAQKGLPVPKIYLDASEEGLVLLEDLGDRTLAFELQGACEGKLKAWYGAAVDLLIAMHARMWPIPKGCIASTRLFDYKLLRWELDHYREWGVEALQNKALDTALRRDLDRAFDALAGEVAGLPRGFVHRDYQSRNLMVVDDEPLPSSLSIIDFQDAFEGPRIYDLVALLSDSYANLKPDFKQEMIDRYARGAGLDGGEAAGQFHLITVQRKLKDGGRFVFLDRVKGDPSFLPYMDNSFRLAHESLERLPGRRELKLALGAADPERFR